MGIKNFIKPVTDVLTEKAADKTFIAPPIDILEGELGKNFYVSIDGILPKAINQLNKFLPVSIPLFDIEDLPVGVSPLGTLVYDRIRFLPGIVRNAKNPLGKPYNGLIIDTVIFEANQQKNIIKTTVQGRDRSIKEYISGGDITISITGAIVNNSTGFYPTRDVTTFTEIMNVPKSLTVQSKFLDLLGIKFMTVESWRLTGQSGFRNVQNFVITAVNDVSSDVNDITGKAI